MLGFGWIETEFFISQGKSSGHVSACPYCSHQEDTSHAHWQVGCPQGEEEL
jgi:hypothetical protein